LNEPVAGAAIIATMSSTPSATSPPSQPASRLPAPATSPAPPPSPAAQPPAAVAARLRPLRSLLPFLAAYKGRIALAGLFLALAAAATLALPAAIKLLVDGGLVPAASAAPTASLGDRLVAVRGHFLQLFGVAMALGVFTAGRFYMVSWIGERVTADLRQAVYSHVLTQSPQFFETLKTGEVLSRLTTDTTVIQSAVGSSISMGLRSTVLCIGGLSMLVLSSPRLMLTMVGIIVIVVLPSLLISRRVRRLSRASQDRIADTSGIAGEVLNAIPVVQSFTQEHAEAQRYSVANEQAFATSVRRTGTRAALTAFLIIGVFGSLLYGLYGGVQAVMAGSMSAGQLSQTALYIMIVASSVAVLAEVWGDLLRASGATERMMELLAARSPIADPAQPRGLPAAAAGVAVQFESVRFTYPSRPLFPVLHDLTLQIAPGQTVALVGPSGAGKTTIFQLLQRFYDIDQGQLRFDGVDVRELAIAQLRGRIAVVPQDPVIFSGTVLENIRYGRSAATDAQALEAARAAYVDAFVSQLPDGYATFVGERGLRLSGGQRQRVAIARAMLKDAPLLLLDEATSSLDAESERAVQAALDAAMRDRTTIVIAHRLATVQRADRIFVLEQGRIVDAGRHAELIARGGLYARLAALQFAT
jgi:ATP-binding cassette subfamily B protein